MRRRLLRPAFAVVAATATLTAGCTAPVLPGDAQGGAAPTTLPPLAPVSAPADDPAGDPSLAAFYGQAVTWEECGEALECTWLTVPVDWDRPDGDTIDLSVVRLPAEGEATASLLVNPGGPGASGVDFVTEVGDETMTPALRQEYDVVGFDPRGVGGSAPIECLDDAETDAYLGSEIEADDEAGGIAELRSGYEAFNDACRENTGDLVDHVDSVSVARDMDVLRAVLGDERLSYLGWSYGTYLGVVYAELFEHRVGRMVLDGAVDPSLSSAENDLASAESLEESLHDYVDTCLSSEECPLHGDFDDGVSQVAGLLEEIYEDPLPTEDPDRPLTIPLAYSAVTGALTSEDLWYDLDLALADAMEGDGTYLLHLADAFSGRDVDGTYPGNEFEAFTVVSCLDATVDDSLDAMEQQAERLAEASPTFGELMSYGELACAGLLTGQGREPGPVDVDGPLPVLVVGSVGDPITPYVWSFSLADQLDGARLLTWESAVHTAYGAGSGCVDAAVDAYLLDGVLPGEGATCSD